MIEKNLIDNIFINPFKKGSGELYILSGYATPNMASLLMKSIPERASHNANINLIVGMTSYDGINISTHNGFKLLHDKPFGKRVKNFSCSYICEGLPVHSNLYVWTKDSVPQIAFTGSADFVQSAFLAHRKEIMTEYNPDRAYGIYLDAVKNSIYCNHNEVEDSIVIHKDKWLDETVEQLTVLKGECVNYIKLSLLTNKNETGKSSGLNWGHRKVLCRNKNEAYIPIPAEIIRTGFFPLDKHFTVITDDNHFLILRTEQQGHKALTTPASNAQLGEYFRNRLKLPNGTFIEKYHLDNYGRTDVDFYKIDDEHFYMDFHV